MKYISVRSYRIFKWIFLTLQIIYLILISVYVDFFSDGVILYILSFYFGWIYISFYDVLIYKNRLIIKKFIFRKEYIFEKHEFDFFERQNFSQSVHRICFKNGKKFYFHIYVMRYSPILPFGFTRKKDANIICWEKWINEMQD